MNENLSYVHAMVSRKLRMAHSLADLHFAPTEAAKQNLLKEGIAETTSSYKGVGPKPYTFGGLSHSQFSGHHCVYVA